MFSLNFVNVSFKVTVSYHICMQKCADAVKFRHAPLDSEDKMRIIFYAHSVTNEHAMVPGSTSHVERAHVDLGDDESGSGGDTPRSGKVTKKRTTGCSPSPKPSRRKTEKDTKITKFLDFVMEKESSKGSVTSTSVDLVRTEIGKMLAQVREAGAEEGSDEHFYASQLLMRKECRDVFITLTTPSGRLGWIKRTWEEKKKR